MPERLFLPFVRSMGYNLIVTNRADELIDSNVFYILNKFGDMQAAERLLNSISEIYDRLENNPFQFPEAYDPYLQKRGYREAKLTQMNYKLFFRVEDKDVYVEGFYNDLEDSSNKVIE